jgi:hypothetical protein
MMIELLKVRCRGKDKGRDRDKGKDKGRDRDKGKDKGRDKGRDRGRGRDKLNVWRISQRAECFRYIRRMSSCRGTHADHLK